MGKHEKQSCAFRTSIGGQALMEGILMRGVDRQAAVCRKADGSLVTLEEPLELIKETNPLPATAACSL